MSSLTSSATDARAALADALTQVAEEGFYSLIDAPHDGWRAEWAAEPDWLEATVAFHGAADGVLRCRLPRALAGELESAFIGLDPSCPEPDPGAVLDMAGELANQICGCWLSRAFRAQLFQLDHPVLHDVGAAPPDDWYVVLMNGTPLGVSVSADG